MKCWVCHRKTETRYIDLYVAGSEGLRICHPCEMRVIEFIQGLSRFLHRLRRAGPVKESNSNEQ